MSQTIGDDKKIDEKNVRGDEELAYDDDVSSVGKGDILSLENTDPVLNAKMHLINNVSTTQRQCLFDFLST